MRRNRRRSPRGSTGRRRFRSCQAKAGRGATKGSRMEGAGAWRRPSKCARLVAGAGARRGGAAAYPQHRSALASCVGASRIAMPVTRTVGGLRPRMESMVAWKGLKRRRWRRRRRRPTQGAGARAASSKSPKTMRGRPDRDDDSAQREEKLLYTYQKDSTEITQCDVYVTFFRSYSSRSAGAQFTFGCNAAKDTALAGVHNVNRHEYN